MDTLQEALKEGILPGIIVGLYLIIVKFIDSRNNKNQAKVNGELITVINNLNTFVKNVTNDAITNNKDRCRNAVRDIMYSSAMRLTNFLSTTIVNNKVTTNKDNILANINNIVNSEFYSMFSTLSMYKIDGIPASDYLNKAWMAVIEKDMIDIIYHNSLSKEDKILSFSNKITIRFQSWITYIVNHIIK